MISDIAQPQADTVQSVRAPETEGELIAALLGEVAAADVVFIARDEIRARTVGSALDAGARNMHVIFCPGSDALPGESAPPSPANAGQRTSALRRLRIALSQEPRDRIALIVTGEGCAGLYPSPDAFDAAPPVFATGDATRADALVAALEDIGYLADERVDEPGEYALRGQVVDIFPADAAQPYRIELADGVIAAIRQYDPVTQLTIAQCDSVEVGRAREPAGSEGVTILDHMPASRVVVDDGADKRRRSFIRLAQDQAGRTTRGAAASICDDDRFETAMNRHERITLEGPFADPPPRFVEERDPQGAFRRAGEEALANGKLLLLGTRRDLRFIQRRAAHILRREAVEVANWQQALAAPAGSVLLLPMPVPRGFRLGDMLVVAASDLLGSRAQREEAESTAANLDPFALSEMRVGDVVVHEEHGLCVVEGLEPTPDGGDTLVLRFAGDARRLVPVLQADRIWRYGGDEDAVTLDKLDGSSWERRRGEVDAALDDTVKELTRIAAERAKRKAAVLKPQPAAYEQFVDGFPFTETPDQLRAVTAVIDDLASGVPMNRLVVGDVGFGKTEVALRAAAVAALCGRQVVLAAPTTVLVRQHLETFARRFADTGIVVAGLSRLSSPAQRKAVRQGLADGSIGVVVGTGAVAAKGVRYADLGLVIVDEEQRFGAADKKRLAELGADHVLTLSATPIPRTLQSALAGLQQLSVIATPPARRQPIRTTIGAFDEGQLRTALLREKARGGQSFVVVPRIEDIDGVGRMLERLVPALDIVQAHGKLPAAELDDVMVRFSAGAGDVLLATNIIEAGLDVPRANTMAVWRADRFGLSQLHQLRGRVGRGSRRGRILLLTEAGAEIAPRTQARLQTLAAFDRLGAGFAISARDLDMRGAGDLLGEEQAGHAKLIGLDLYRHLLETALAKARGQEVIDWSPVVSIGEGRLTAEWIPEEDLRISLYGRLARIADLAEFDRFDAELADRFGTVPQEAAMLLSTAKLRVLARMAGIARLDAGPAAIALTPRAGRKTALGALKLTRSEDRWLCKGDFTEPSARIARAEELLMRLIG
ncbi:helicase-related protein [Novosphingobium gossypii]|uniref:helicase-related protein n=1 Tax=Novosphingobium gossypii TaxID=1604774 RepID=UPI003D1C72D3